MQRFDAVGMTPPRGRLGHSVPTPRLLGKPLADVGPLYQTRNIIARVRQLVMAPLQQLHSNIQLSMPFVFFCFFWGGGGGVVGVEGVFESAVRV